MVSFVDGDERGRSEVIAGTKSGHQRERGIVAAARIAAGRDDVDEGISGAAVVPGDGEGSVLQLSLPCADKRAVAAPFGVVGDSIELDGRSGDGLLASIDRARGNALAGMGAGTAVRRIHSTVGRAAGQQERQGPETCERSGHTNRRVGLPCSHRVCILMPLRTSLIRSAACQLAVPHGNTVMV